MPVSQFIPSRCCSSDLQQVVSLINKHCAGSYESTPYTAKSFERLIDDGSVLILTEGCIKGVLASAHWARGDFIEVLAPSIDCGGQAADLLLREFESMLNRDIFVWVDSEAEVNAWMARGYRRGICWDHMVSPLVASKVSPPSGCNTLLRELRPDEEADLIEVVNASFGRERLKKGCVERWKEEHGDFDESWIHVAEVDGRMVSAVVSSPDREYNEYYGKRRGYLGPAATLPEFRCRGIAGSLVVKAMNFLFSKGLDSVSLYTDEKNSASQALLRRLGFVVRHRWVEMAKTPGKTH